VEAPDDSTSGKRIQVPSPTELGYFDRAILRLGDQNRITVTFPGRIPLAGVSFITFEVLCAIYNSMTPKPHPSAPLMR